MGRRGSSPRGRSGQWGGGRQWPTANRGSLEWRKGAAVVFGARECVAREKEGK
jgi:hypothetical protein